MVRIDAADKLKTEFPCNVLLTNFVFRNNRNEYSTLIRVFENSYLEIDNSVFENNFSKTEGGVICGDYQKARISIKNSVFTRNSASKGGVFCNADWSYIRCDNCHIHNNFALQSAVMSSQTNGYFTFINSVIENNFALTVPVLDLIDVADPSEISNTIIRNNTVISKSDFLAQNTSCTFLCHIPKEYMK